MKKIIIAFFALLLSVPITAMAYNDIEPGTELDKATAALTEYGVLNGYGDGNFKPDNDVTRAEMCKMINVLFNFTDVGSNDFTDVKPSDWFYTQVLIANEYEYITGYPDNTFGGNKNVTREQASVIINRLTPLIAIENTVTITDEVSAWATDAVQMIANHKLLQCDENGRFRAKENLKRGELALLLYRFIPVEKNTYEVGYKGTNAEIAIENAVILANLKAAVKDIESVQFYENEQPIIDAVLVGLNGTIDAGMNGQLINKQYVVKNYLKEIKFARSTYKSMTDEEKALFHGNLVELNNSTLLFLQSYFLGDKSPV